MVYTEYDEIKQRQMDRDDGYAEGHAEGYAIGTLEKEIEIISNMLSDGLTPEAIHQYTRISLDLILEIQKKLNN